MEEYIGEIIFILGIFAILFLAGSVLLLKLKADSYARQQCKYGNVNAGSSIKVYKK